MSKKITEPKWNDEVGLREEVHELFLSVVREATADEMAVIHEKLDRIMLKLDLILERQEHGKNPMQIKIDLLRKIES